MPATSPEVAKLKDYLLTQRPTTVESAGKLARRFNVDRKQAERQLDRAGYTKADDGPSWNLPNHVVDSGYLRFDVHKDNLRSAWNSLEEDPEWLERYTDKNAVAVDLVRLLSMVFKAKQVTHLVCDSKGINHHAPT